MSTQSDELRRQAAALLAQAAEVETPMTAADVKKLYAEKRYDEIEAARAGGRLNDLLGGLKTKPEGN
jgi:hypothetical protein